MPFRRFGIYLRDCVEQEEKNVPRHYPCDFVKTTKKRPVGLSDVTERANETGRRPEIFASAEQVTNIIRTSHAQSLSYMGVKSRISWKINFYLLLLLQVKISSPIF